MSQSNPEWWRGCVVYQIYPRSFCDSNGDGIGDLPGITSRLEYVAELGVDAIWISPFLESPQKDFGYDVSNYRLVDPMFGSNEDLEALIRKAHDLGLKVLMDHVLSHTSDRHPWFMDSRSSRHAAKADWYVWADPKADGTPPNNWLSVFGGSAWQWDARRCQYYLHNFLACQPDLNFHNPEVTAQILDEVEFWLERGVDGYRLDTVNFYFHDHQLRDNPIWPRGVTRTDGIPLTNPYGYQRHIYDKTQPENLEFLRRLRQVFERYPGSVAIGELAADHSFPALGEYTSGRDRLHMAYTFDLLREECGAEYIRSVITELEAHIHDGWPCWSLGNHDVTRVVTRWGGQNPSPELARVLMAFLLSLRGSACIYQGEELGLTDADVPYELLRDPYGLAFWPEYKGRDGCRTPMPWTHTDRHAGFSTAEPWLPVPDEHRQRAVSVQEAAPGSILHTYRRFLKWRKTVPELRTGTIEILDVPAPALAFVRALGDERVLAAFNLGSMPVSIPIAPGLGIEPLRGHGVLEGARTEGTIELPGHAAYFGRTSIGHGRGPHA